VQKCQECGSDIKIVNFNDHSYSSPMICAECYLLDVFDDLGVKTNLAIATLSLDECCETVWVVK
jgi:hypothetical protein